MADEEPELPSIVRRLSTDEYEAPPLDASQRKAQVDLIAGGPEAAKRVNRPLADYWSSRLGTAAGLRALNGVAGQECYIVPPEAELDQAAADDALGGDQLVIDVQTHYMADRPHLHQAAEEQISMYKASAPRWWTGLNDITFLGFSEYLRSIFVESETAVAILTSPPADELGRWILDNDEIAVTRELIDRVAGTGRMLNHTVVQPTDPGTLEKMETWRDLYKPVAWKVYTTGNLAVTEGEFFVPESGWMLDDERYGIPFLERARELGVNTICSHKGLSMLVDNGSPRDIGPCAERFPDMNFIVYHSGFEGVARDEGPYTPETRHLGINRLISTAADHGIGVGGNIYAELGTTWFCLVKRPIEAAHVIGKLLLAFGEDNIMWGTDGIWYGPTQPVIDAFRAFTIPENLREQYGYPQLTARAKEKILGLNAARVYGIDVESTLHAARTDDLSWARQAYKEMVGSTV
jgi:hypothetical protein